MTIFRPSDYIRICKSYGFNKEYINALLSDKALFDFFFKQVDAGFEPKNIAKRIAGPLLKSGMPIDQFLSDFSTFFIKFLTIEKKGGLMDNQLKIVFDEMLATHISPDEIIKQKGFDAPAMGDSALEAIIYEVIDENPAQVAQYKAGKEALLAFFVGQAMKKTGGKANPQTIQSLTKTIINQSKQ